MRRRQFITLLGGAAAAWPLAARAAVGDAGDRLSQRTITERLCRQCRCIPPGPRRTGYVEGRNVKVEYVGRKDTMTGTRRASQI
jgi:putative ABC transport system substrate-binding protein